MAAKPAPEWKTVAGTGHRPQHLSQGEADWARAQLPKALRRLANHHGTQIIISGMALGWDTWLAEAALAAGFDLHAHVPCPQQPDPWRPAEQEHWRHLLKQATTVTYYGDTYHVRHLHARNAGMLAAADAVLALWDAAKTSGGTYRMIEKVIDAGKPLLHVDPVGQTVQVATEVKPWRSPRQSTLW